MNTKQKERERYGLPEKWRWGREAGGDGRYSGTFQATQRDEGLWLWTCYFTRLSLIYHTQIPTD